MSRIQQYQSVMALLCLQIALGACKGPGVQGGDIPDQFPGLTVARSVSPTSIELGWNSHTKAGSYKVYNSELNSPIYQPSFTSYVFTVPNPDATKTYYYSVTAVDDTGQELGERNNYTGVNLLPHFDFKNTGSLTRQGNTSLRATWTAYAGVNYRVYLAERTATGSVSYNFITSSANVSEGAAVFTGLQEGREYCAFAVATYIDNTIEGPDGTAITGTLSTALASNDWSLGSGSNGTFANSKIGLSQKCERTGTSFNFSNILVYLPKATLSTKPVFYVKDDVPSTVQVSAYEYSDTTGQSTFLGSRTGLGTITSSVDLTPGSHKFFAVARALSSGNPESRIEITVLGTTPADENSRIPVYIRGLPTSEADTAPLGYYASPQQGNHGAQRLGSSIAMGDFDCDGKSDLAIGIPSSTILANDGRPARQGKVVVYYDIGTGTPAAPNRTQEITFDITGQTTSDSARNLGLGRKLFVGNFNGDNYTTNQAGGGSETFKSCDDLAIGSEYGPLFVVYGKRNVSGNDGGLSFDNSTNYIVNPSTSCDPSSNVCQPAAYLQYSTNAYRYMIGYAMTSGDFNGDGYQDLVASSGTPAINGSAVTPMGVWVFRGGQYGLVPPTSYSTPCTTDSKAESITTVQPGSFSGYPYLPLGNTFTVGGGADCTKTTATTSIDANLNHGGTNSNGETTNFGISLAAFKNAYYDASNGRMKDFLLIGAPGLTYNDGVAGTGRVIACAAKTTDTGDTQATQFTDDVNANMGWDCSYQINAPKSASNSRQDALGFGYSMATLTNPLRYYPNHFRVEVANLGTCENADVVVPGYANCNALSTNKNLGFPGGVVVGAITSAKAYAYYGVAAPSAAFNPAVDTRDTIGGYRNTYITNLFNQKKFDGATTVTLTTPNNPAQDIPCAFSALPEACQIQPIVHPNTSTGNFTSVIAALNGNNTDDLEKAKESILAIAAPDRNFTISGLSYTSVGSVQLYGQSSRSTANPYSVYIPTTNCQDTGAICRLSTGFSSTLTSALDYDGTLASNIRYGSGGIVGGPTRDPSGSALAPTTDILIGAPGYTASISGDNVLDSGAAILFFSHNGTYRSYPVGSASQTPSSWHIIKENSVAESDLKFHQAVSLGDINSDGYSDVAVRVSQGTNNKHLIYNGSTGSVGLSSTPATFSVQGDSTAGYRLIPAGRLTNGQFSTFFVTGQDASYLYFGGVSGLLGGVPSAGAQNGVPRKFYVPGNGSTTLSAKTVDYLSFLDSEFYHAENSTTIDSALNIYAPFAHGDFNGDGYEDFAFGTNHTNEVTDLATSGVCSSSSASYGNEACGRGTGRVYIMYGGASNGPQTQPDTNGGYPLASSYFTTLSALGTESLGRPCAVAGTGCKIQMLYLDAATSFGSSIAAVPSGTCTITGSGAVNSVSSLVVRSNDGTNSKIHVFKPKCISTTDDRSGLVYDSDLSIPAPYSTSATLGTSMFASSNIQGTLSTRSHLIVTDPTNTGILVYPVLAGVFGSTCTPSLGNACTDGARVIKYPSSSIFFGEGGFGNGVAPIGDINGDGYNDIAIGMTSLVRRDSSLQREGQGSVMVMFGGANGLQSHTAISSGYVVTEPTRDAPCYADPVYAHSSCAPTLLYAPQPQWTTMPVTPRDGAYERTFLSPYSRLDFQTTNASLGSFVFGVPGRDGLDLSNRHLNGGVFYVLP